ncbi:MAG: hypothetical protein HUU19_14870 [Phycisphaerales bacterium]|nr:hypothetical protein [Phycisphaerales bacterium]
MIGSALAFVLARLDQLESPVFSHEEFARFPAADLATLLRDGIVYEGVPAEEIDRPSRFRRGGRLAVCRTAKGLFGCPCEGDPYFDPIPLIEDDVRQYEVSIDRLIDRIRGDNAIDGTGYAASQRVMALGERRVEGWGAVDVYLGFGLCDDASLLAACRHLRPETSPRSVVLLVPTVIARSPERRRAIDTTRVLIEPLWDAAQRGSLAVSWEIVLGAPDVGQKRRVSKDLRLFCRDGATWRVAYGGQSTTIGHSLGMTYLSYVLDRPSTSLNAIEVAGSAGRSVRSKVRRSESRLAKARGPEDTTPLREGSEALDRAEAEARRAGDTKRLKQLREIRSMTEADAREAGRSTATESPEAKRVRQAVSKAIERAIKSIAARHAALGRHLSGSIETGGVLRYKGDPNDRWVTEAAAP